MLSALWNLYWFLLLFLVRLSSLQWLCFCMYSLNFNILENTEYVISCLLLVEICNSYTRLTIRAASIPSISKFHTVFWVTHKTTPFHLHNNLHEKVLLPLYQHHPLYLWGNKNTDRLISKLPKIWIKKCRWSDFTIAQAFLINMI